MDIYNKQEENGGLNMTKRVIGILLVFLMIVSNISVTFAADASQNYNDDMTKDNSSVSE